MGKVLALAGKDLRLLWRDRSGFFFVFFFPLLIAIFFGVIFSGDGGETAGIPIALADQDSSAGSTEFARILSAAEELQVLQTDREEAIRLVRGGKRSAYVALRPGFGEAWGRVYWGSPAQIEIGVDPARKAESGMLQGVLTRYFMEGMQKTFQDPAKMRGQLRSSLDELGALPDSERAGWAWSPLVASLTNLDSFLADQETTAVDTSAGAFKGWEPLRVEVSDVAVQRAGPRNSFEITFPQAIIWAMLGSAAAFGISLVVERTRGTLIRLRVAPLSRRQILAGKGLACLVTIIAVSCLLLVIAALVFGVRPHSMPLLGLALLSSALCFVGIMQLLSVLGKTEASAGGIGWAALLVMAMLGGGMIPLFFMPAWMQTVSNLSPVKWVVLSLEGAVWRGFTLPEMLLPCGILVGIGAAAFALGARAFRWTAE